MKARLDRRGASTVQLDLGNWALPALSADGNTRGFTNGSESSIYE